MIDIITCPECGKIINNEYYTDEVGIVEEHINCPYCGYHYNWAYGSDLDPIDEDDNIAQNDE